MIPDDSILRERPASDFQMGANGGPPLDDDVTFSLHPKQVLAFTTWATEVLYGGAAGGGKSHFMRVAAILWCMAIPGLQVYLFRRNYPDLISNHMEGEGSFPELLGPLVRAKICKIVWTPVPSIEWWNGAVISLRHCQHEKDVIKYQGAQMHVLMIDELTQWTKKMYTYLRSRVRKTKMLPIPEHLQGQFPRILLGANPGGIGHNWVKMDFVNLGEPLTVYEMPKKEGGMFREFIPAYLEDNPSLDAEEYEGKLEGIDDEALARAMRHGDWDIVSGGMFDDIWMKHKRAIVVKAFDIPKSWRIDRSFDWGSSRPFSVGWWAESNGEDVKLADGTWRSTVKGDLFRIAEWYGWNGEADKGLKMTADEVAKGIVERELEMKLYGRVWPGAADGSIFDEENGNCIATDMQQAVRIGGKVYPGVAWERADKGPGSVEAGLELIRTRLNNTSRPKGGGVRERPGLFIFSHCTQTLRVLPVAPRDDKNPKILAKTYEDHIIDEIRYRLRAPRRTATGGRTRGLSS